ncbi:MAG: zinc metallopeptidase, partial [Planctomycetota bacterium]
PVEFDASNRAKALVNEMGIVDASGGVAVNKVLGAAGWTYVAAMLQTLMTVLYYVFILTGRGGSDE